MEAKSYLMSDNEFVTSLQMIIGAVRKHSGYTIHEVTGMDVEELTDMVMTADSMIPKEILKEIEWFFMQADDESTVWLLRTDSEVCGIISIKDS